MKLSTINILSPILNRIFQISYHFSLKQLKIRKQPIYVDLFPTTKFVVSLLLETKFTDLPIFVIVL